MALNSPTCAILTPPACADLDAWTARLWARHAIRLIRRLIASDDRSDALLRVSLEFLARYWSVYVLEKMMVLPDAGTKVVRYRSSGTRQIEAITDVGYTHVCRSGTQGGSTHALLVSYSTEITSNPNRFRFSCSDHITVLAA
jgi:hypothetical protein